MTTIDSFIEFMRDDTGRTPTTVWVICPQCRGEGTSSLYLGAYSQDEFFEMDEDWRDDYMAGRFDRQCETCGGSGKVRTIPEESPWAEAWWEWQADEAADRAVRRAESGYAW